MFISRSQNWECPVCGKIADKLSKTLASSITPEERDLINQISLKVKKIDCCGNNFF